MNLEQTSTPTTDSLLDYISTRSIVGSFQEELLGYKTEDAQALQQLIHHLAPSANALRGILDLAKEIAARDRSALHEVLQGDPIRKVCQDQHLDRKEKQKRVRRLLEEQRFPVLNKIQQELESAQRSIRQELGLDLDLPKDLEGDAIELRLSAKCPKDLTRLAEKLTQLAEHDSTKRIFALLKGDFEL